MNTELFKRNNENDFEYHKRLVYGKLVDKTLSDVDYTELSEFVYNQKLSSDVCRREMYGSKYTLKLLDEVGMNLAPTDYQNELNEKIIQLQKEQIKNRDYLNEIRRIRREEARKEEFKDIIKEVLTQNVSTVEIVCSGLSPIELTDQEMYITVADVHAGLKIDNHFNKYDELILWKRFDEYFETIKEIQSKEKCKTCRVLCLGDLISGIIHLNLRIENNMNVIEQLALISNVLSSFVGKLSSIFENVIVHGCSGNHSRISPNKEHHLKGEELDDLVLFYLQASLKHVQNVEIALENELDNGIASFTSKGKLHYMVHGDKDTRNTVIASLTLLTDNRPNFIWMGHRHTNGLLTEYNTKVIEAGCMQGTDGHAIDHRYNNRPEQIVMVMNNKGRACYYDIQF